MQTPTKTKPGEPSASTFTGRALRRLVRWLAFHPLLSRLHICSCMVRPLTLRRRRKGTVDKHLLYHDLCAALQSEGCPICRLVAINTQRRLQFLFHESVNDPGVRTQMRAALGFCRRHAAEAARLGQALGLALLYADIVAQARCRLRQFDSGVPTATPSLCPECVAEREDETRYILAFADDLQDPQMQALYGPAHGLCVPHLEAVLRRASSPVLTFLCEQEERKLSALAQELEELARKFDHRHCQEPMGAERDSWRRALMKMAGFQPSRKEHRDR